MTCMAPVICGRPVVILTGSTVVSSALIFALDSVTAGRPFRGKVTCVTPVICCRPVVTLTGSTVVSCALVVSCGLVVSGALVVIGAEELSDA